MFMLPHVTKLVLIYCQKCYKILGNTQRVTCAEKMHLLSFTMSSLTRRSSPFGSSPL